MFKILYLLEAAEAEGVLLARPSIDKEFLAENVLMCVYSCECTRVADRIGLIAFVSCKILFLE